MEHDIQSEHADLSVVQYVLVDPLVREALGISPIPEGPPIPVMGAGVVTREMEDAIAANAKIAQDAAEASPAEAKAKVVEQLAGLGFSAPMIAGPVTGLSGGWKMKLALARVILSKVELALLDEPTNHLDVQNAAWLTEYLVGLTDVSLMVVSHDSQFLDAVCTHIVHYEGFRLRTYKGNLSCFVEKKPEAKSYYELSETAVKFAFPEPGFLDGVKSKDKAILKMSTASYTYPGRDKPSVIGASIACSLSSRVVIHGRNGAGKSTLVKMLTGEIEPSEGGVWKHPSLRIAYVAQNAFHHIEEHLNLSPSEYIQWRYASGEDREALVKVSRVITEEEEKRMAAVQTLNGVKLVVKELLARRKSGRSWEYEVAFVGQPADKNQWMPRDWLEAIGWGKAVDALDAREAAAAGLHSKPLTAANIVKHLEALGLEAEFALHHRIRGLSGGQKIKLVLGAALWQNPHIVVMDEPSNVSARILLLAVVLALLLSDVAFSNHRLLFAVSTLLPFPPAPPPAPCSTLTATPSAPSPPPSRSSRAAWCSSRTTATSPRSCAPRRGTSWTASSPPPAPSGPLRRSRPSSPPMRSWTRRATSSRWSRSCRARSSARRRRRRPAGARPARTCPTTTGIKQQLPLSRPPAVTRLPRLGLDDNTHPGPLVRIIGPLIPLCNRTTHTCGRLLRLRQSTQPRTRGSADNTALPAIVRLMGSGLRDGACVAGLRRLLVPLDAVALRLQACWPPP